MKSGLLLALVLGALTLIRLLLVTFEHPSPGEAYYLACAEHPAAAYFDGPAGTAMVAGTLEKITGSDLAWRLTSPLWALLASLACFILVRQITDAHGAFLATLLLNALPAFNVAALRAGPWMPALAFVLIGLFCAWRAFESAKHPLIWWFFTGVFLAKAVIFTYSAAFIIPAVALFVLCSPKHRKRGDFIGLAIMVVIPVAVIIPALCWNASQEWIPLAGGTFRTLWGFGGRGAVVSLEQSLYSLSPLIWLGLIAAWIVTAPAIRTRVRHRFIFLCALPGVALGLYSIYRGENGIFFFLLAAPLLFPGAFALLVSWRWHRWLTLTAVALAVVLSLFASGAAFLEGRGWVVRAAEVRSLFLEKLEQGQDNLFLIAQNPPMASILGHYLKADLIPPPGHPVVYVRESQDISNQYSLWPGYGDFIETGHIGDERFTEQKGENPFVGRSAFYITTESGENLPQSIQAAFESVKLLKTIPADGPGEDALYIYLCVNYETLPL